MAGNKVHIEKDSLVVENSDMLKNARVPAAKDLLKISPFFVYSEINLRGAPRDAALDKKIVATAQKKADAYEKELVQLVKKLVDDLIALRKKDQQDSDDKLGSSAETKVKSVSEGLEEALVEFGHEIRKSLKNLVKLTSRMKSISRGQFRGLKLIYTFSGGRNSAFVEAYEETAEDVAAVGKKATAAAGQEKSHRTAVIGAGETAIKQAREREKHTSSPSAADDRWTKLVLKTARAIQELLEAWQQGLQAFQKKTEHHRRWSDLSGPNKTGRGDLRSAVSAGSETRAEQFC